MIDLRDIHPLSDFQRNAKAHIKRLQKTRRPLVLTVNGRGSVVVLAIEAYEELVRWTDGPPDLDSSFTDPRPKKTTAAAKPKAKRRPKGPKSSKPSTMG